MRGQDNIAAESSLHWDWSSFNASRNAAFCGSLPPLPVKLSWLVASLNSFGEDVEVEDAAKKSF